jgi:hypothetical protein
MITREEMKDRIADDMSPWQMRVMCSLGEQVAPPSPSTVDNIPPLEEATLAAMQTAADYAATPGHGEGLSESEIHYCVAMGIRKVQQHYYGVLSPVDRLGLPGPKPVGELLSAAVGSAQANRDFTGAAAEPRPPRLQTPDTGGPYPWSWYGQNR